MASSVNSPLRRQSVDEAIDRATALIDQRPPLIDVKSRAWYTHPSGTVNLKATFEVPADLETDDYERLEVSDRFRPRAPVRAGLS